jgi:hypothetical protein
MCPVCLGSVAWLIAGGVSGLGTAAGGVAIVRRRRMADKASKIGKSIPRSWSLASGGSQTQEVQIRKLTGDTHGKE